MTLNGLSIWLSNNENKTLINPSQINILIDPIGFLENKNKNVNTFVSLNCFKVL